MMVLPSPKWGMALRPHAELMTDPHVTVVNVDPELIHYLTSIQLDYALTYKR